MNRRTLLLAALTLPAAIPVIASLTSLLDPLSPHWPHLFDAVLPQVLLNTGLLLVVVVTLAALLGTGLAWLTARYEFPGRRWLHVALLMPLAMPGYVLGFVAIAGLDYSGPLQTALRTLFGTDAALWQIRSRWGAALVLALTLYPYVYLVAGNAFRSISASTLEMAASLGRTAIFRSVALPMALPWITAALLLVAMETLADFGTVALFNVDTFTTAIYKSWYGLFSIELALQLASILVLVALALSAAHARSAGRGSMVQHGPPLPRISPQRPWLLTLLIGSFVLLLVGVPLTVLLGWSIQHLAVELDPRYLRWLFNSLSLALSAGLALTAMALLLAYLGRGDRSRLNSGLTRIATIGYALPGALIAVGLFAPISAVEALLGEWIKPGWATQGFVVLLLGYAARFLAVAHTPVAQQLRRISPSIDESARLQGVGGGRLLRQVHAPLVSGAVATAAALVVIDVIKEMPITLMTRPFGWDTLATRVFELTAEGEYERAALPALSIVIAGLLPVILILRRGERGRQHLKTRSALAHAA